MAVSRQKPTMRSVRLGQELERRLKRAVQASGLAASEIIRQGVDVRVAALLGETLAEQWSDVIGKHASGRPGVARQTGREFARGLARRTGASSRRRRSKAG